MSWWGDKMCDLALVVWLVACLLAFLFRFEIGLGGLSSWQWVAIAGSHTTQTNLPRCTTLCPDPAQHRTSVQRQIPTGQVILESCQDCCKHLLVPSARSLPSSTEDGDPRYGY